MPYLLNALNVDECSGLRATPYSQLLTPCLHCGKGFADERLIVSPMKACLPFINEF